MTNPDANRFHRSRARKARGVGLRHERVMRFSTSHKRHNRDLWLRHRERRRERGADISVPVDFAEAMARLAGIPENDLPWTDAGPAWPASVPEILGPR